MEENVKTDWTPFVFYGVSKFKSLFRAYRRGHIGLNGDVLPMRLFHNRANTSKRRGVDSRRVNTLKKKAYGEYREMQLKGRI